MVGGPRLHNYLVILADDMGTDKVAAYGEHPSPPLTPRLDALAEEGVLFRNAYAATVCSPSRANLITGRHSRRHGLGQVIRPHSSDYVLSLDEYTLPEMLTSASPPWATGLAGKWHLAGYLGPEPELHALQSGFDHHLGTLSNLDQTLEADDVGGYYDWEYWIDGERRTETQYATTVNVDDALLMMDVLPEPWFIFASLNAPHAPYEAPPDELLSEPYVPDDDWWVIFDVMVEAMDTEIGRLLDGTNRDDTVIVFMGDNGTPTEFVRAPWDPLRAKGTIYEAGINVPLLVTGPGVVEPGRESDALVHIVDLFGTAQHLAGVPRRELPSATDGTTLLPYLYDAMQPSQRETVVSEWFVPFDATVDPSAEMLAVRDDRYKYVRLWDEMIGVEAERLYDLGAVDIEGPDLLTGALSADESAALERLRAAADAHRSLAE